MKTIALVIITFGLLSANGCTQNNSAQSPQNANSSNVEINANRPVNASQNVYSANDTVSEVSNTDVASPVIDEEIETPETPAAPDYSMRMLMNSEYYEEEVEDEIGVHRGWLGLYRKKDKYVLLPTAVEVEKTRHDLRDDKDSAEETGRKVSSNIKLPNVFLLKNAPMLRQGEVTTVFYGNEENSDGINRQYRREFDFNGGEYTVYVEDASGETGEFLTNKSKLIVKRGKTEQTIYETDYCSDCAWNLCWVGDLDRDGELDFLFNLTPHYNSTCHRLFLSSQAKKGEIIRDVAEVCQMGC